MAKTITLRIEEDLYEAIKEASVSQNRSIANYIEHATRSYMLDESFVSEEEMEDIMKDKDFVRTIRSSLSDIEKGNYSIVE